MSNGGCRLGLGSTEQGIGVKMARNSKSVGAAYFFMLFSFTGVCGIQHFYLGNVWKGVVWLFTFGLLGVGLLWDLFTLPHQVRKS